LAKLHDNLLNQQPDFRTFVQTPAVFGGLHYGNPQVPANKLIDAGKRAPEETRSLHKGKIEAVDWGVLRSGA